MGWRRSSERRNNATQPNYSGPEIPFPTRCAISHNAQYGTSLRQIGVFQFQRTKNTTCLGLVLSPLKTWGPRLSIL
jgi:hypothetical protein